MRHGGQGFNIQRGHFAEVQKRSMVFPGSGTSPRREKRPAWLPELPLPRSCGEDVAVEFALFVQELKGP
jgi:hypothetical protein